MPIGTSDGEHFDNLFESRVASAMPSEASTEPAGALKQASGGVPAEKVSETDSNQKYSPNLLEQAQSQYPILKNYDYGYTENFRPNAGFLEHWQPGDEGIKPSSSNSLNSLRPSTLPLDKPGLEIRDPDTKPSDIMADITSHHLINADPFVKKTYEDFQNSLTSKQHDILKDQYDYAQKNEGETGTYEDWKQRSGMPAFLRGYAFKQWPDEFNDKAYTPEQKQSLDKMVDYLKSTPYVRPEPYGLNPPERGPGWESPPRPAPQVLFKTKNGITITDHDVEDATNVAMSAGPGTIDTKLRSYIDMFVKTPKLAEAQAPVLDSTEQAIKAIMEVMEGPGAYEAKYGSGKKTVPITESGKKIEPFEQVPFGDSKDEWSILTPAFNEKYGHDYFESKPESKIVNSLNSAYDKIVNTVDQVHNKLFNKMLNERAKFHQDRAAGLLPKEAIEAGYDTPAFRGMKNKNEIQPIHDFDKAVHMYSSDSPLLADMYADYLSKHPGWNVKSGAFSEGATIAPLVINTKDYHVYDAKGSMWIDANNVAIREAREAGKPGVIVKNVWDEPNSTKSLGSPTTVYITLPSGANTVKSRHASKFDSSSPNMLHTIPVLAVGGAAGYVSKEIEPDKKG